MTKIVCILIAALVSTPVCAQAPYLYFNHITTENGLSHNKVNCVLQDKRGFMWIGTEDGLNRYDGQYFTVFRNRPNDTTTISGNIITDLLEDQDSVIWIATSDGGLTKYDYRQPPQKQFKQYKHIAGDTATIPVNIINKITEDKKGYLWLATSGAYVLRFDRRKEIFESPVHSGTRTIASLAMDKEGILWAGRIGGSFLKLNTATLQYESDERYDDLYAKLPHASITSLYIDKENNIWFGSWDNILYCFNTKTKKETAFKQDNTAFSFPDDEADCFAEDAMGRLWIAGKYFGLTIYDKQQNKFFNYRYNPVQEGSISDNQINCVYIDKAGLIWLGSGKGLNVYNPAQQPFVQTFLLTQNHNTTIYDFYQDENNRLWIGTNEGIYIYHPDGSFKLKKIVYKGEQLAVTKFFKDADGTFYIGTDYSLFVYNSVQNTVSLLRNTEKDKVMSRIIDSRVVSVIRDTIEGHPVLLVSPYGHFIAYYDFAEKRWVSRKDSVKNIVTRFNLRDNLIRKFYKSSGGHIWFATVKSGLGAWHTSSQPKLFYFTNNPKVHQTLSNDHVYDVLEDGKGNLWVSTYGGGLNYFNTRTKTFRHITSSNNLLEGIQIDAHGKVWIISNGNIDKYDPLTNAYTTYTLPDLEKSGGVKGYIYKDNRNNFYVAGTNYFIRFDPLTVRDINKPLKVYLTDFRIFNTSYSDLLSNKNIRLRYFQNYFSLEFAAPEFTSDPVLYSYMLEGVDKDWMDAGTYNIANYSNLPGGEYIFKVRASNKRGSFDNGITAITITIIPPFWQQWWFYLSCCTVAAAAIYLFYRYRINEVLKREAIRNRIAQDLHDNVGSTLSSISVYSQVAKIYHEQNKQQQLDQTLEKIGETSGDMIAEMADIVWAINPRNDHMGTIIQRMESYAKPLLQAKGIHFNLSYDASIPDLNLQMDKRKNFYLIFKEAVNNALKYSDCKTLDTIIRLLHHKIEFIIKDDGKGFDISKTEAAVSGSLSGNGLKNIQMRAKEMKATITITSNPGKGTAIFLSFNIP